MTEHPISAERRLQIIKILSAGPMNGADIARALGCNSSIACNILGRMLHKREVCRVRNGMQQWRYCLGETFQEAEAPPPPKAAPREGVYQVEVPRHPGSPERHIMRVSLPAAPWGACA